MQLTSFIGREREIMEITQALSHTRLLTLTGSGGCGKTRLALQVATSLVGNFTDGVWLAELASLSDRALVPKAVASALNLPERRDLPLGETLKRHLQGKTLLLVLDNCEHLSSACVQLTGTLLPTCPNLSILATSREELGIAGELNYRVPGLSLPDPSRLPPLERLGQSEAVRLFVERAAFRRSGFVMTGNNAPAVAQVCSKLDGIPLAIELAAARVKGLTVEQIAARLHDRFHILTEGNRTALPRQQTLRATMDWSYDLLSQGERTLLRRVSVFAGGFAIEAAEDICSGGTVAALEVLDLLLRLVDRSMVVAGERGRQSRYRLLETTRQYAWEKLVEAGEADEIRRRHFIWYLTLAGQADGKLRGPEQQAWLDRLEAEHDNLRAALEWSNIDPRYGEEGGRLAIALYWFWSFHGHWSEGRRWLEAAVSSVLEAPLEIAARALRYAAYMAFQVGDYSRASVLARRGLTSSRESGDAESLVYCRAVLGHVAVHNGDYDQAAQLFEENLNLCRTLNDEWLLGWPLAHLGDIARDRADFARAAALHAESLAMFRKSGDRLLTAYALRNLGVLALRRGDCKETAAFCGESLALCRAIGNRWVAEECLMGLAGVAALTAQYARAARLFAAAEALRTTHGRQRSITDQADFDKRVASTRTALGDSAFAAAWAQGALMPLDEAIEVALAPIEKTKPTHVNLLTAREREVAALIAQGLSNRGIALRLMISERTADTHVQNILNKLGVSSRAQVAVWAVEHGLQQSPPT
ncbi:MAG TPA: LuxR C-terminal-related transcriptional regulator [Anaerolineales bacterium]